MPGRLSETQKNVRKLYTQQRIKPSLVRQYVVAVAPALLAVSDMRSELSEWSGEAIDDMKDQLDFYVDQVPLHGRCQPN